MWVPRDVINWFTTLRNAADTQADIAKEALSSLREELSAVRSERDTLKTQLVSMEAHFNWIRMQINTLQMERAALLEKAHGITVPAPQVQRRMEIDPALDPNNFSYDDLGDEAARKLGLPTYD